MNFKILLAFSIVVLTFSNCSDDTDYTAVDKVLIETFLTDNNLTATEHETGIFYTITQTGDGQHPSSSDIVKVKYRGTLLDGTVFDATPQGDVSGPWSLGGLIQGWQIAIPLLERGGKGTFYIPSALGYGSQANGSIPANSVLAFDIELVDF